MKSRRASRDDQKPTKEEYAVAKCLKFKAPSKNGKFEGNNVQYFMGSKIVDFLLESQWSSKKCKTNPLFNSRSTCTAYCSRLLSKGFFCRVEKHEKKKKEIQTKEDIIAGLTKRSKSKKDIAKSKKSEEEGDLKSEEQSGDEKDQVKDDSSSEDKKKKKKMSRLNFHSEQKFVDGIDLYVWLYDPIPVKTFIIGLLLVVGAVAICLFPLWPPEIKLGIYYLSCCAFGFIGVILALCVVRVILFVLVWLFSMGEVSLWLLPNLTEDVGFFESFKPLYKIAHGQSDKKDKSKSTKASKELNMTEKSEEVEEEEEGKEEFEDNEEDNAEDAGATAPEDVGGETTQDEEEALGGDSTQDEEPLEGEEEEDEDGNDSYEVIDADEDDDKKVADDDDDDNDDDDDDGDDNIASGDHGGVSGDEKVGDKKND